jgi:hypothetical protein
MRSISARSVGICATGLPNWSKASRVLTEADAFQPDSSFYRAASGLPLTESRRINATSRLACLAAHDALASLPESAIAAMPAIFTSSDGDGAVLLQMLKALAQGDVSVSPTAFHNSVYNAPAGYYSIATRSTAPSTTVCADESSFAAAMLEGYAQAHLAAGPVLVVAVDVPFPDPIQALGLSDAAFACAIVLDGACDGPRPSRISRWAIVDGSPSTGGSDSLSRAFGNNSAAAAIPLLRALAGRERAHISLPYLDGTSLELEVTP